MHGIAANVPVRGRARPAWPARWKARREADRLLRASDGRWESHDGLVWRVAELTSARERRTLARSLRGIVKEATSPQPMLSASPLNRRRLAPYTGLIGRLAERVGDLERPVTAAGIVLLRDLLTDGASPLYVGGDVKELPAALRRIESLLEVH
jgi:hypothetical protein